MDDIIEVICMVFPTGQTFWLAGEDKTKTTVDKILDSFWKHHPEFKDTRCSMGMVSIFMPEEKYNSIKATNEGWFAHII